MTESNKLVLELVRKSLDKGYQLNTSVFSTADWAEVFEIAAAQGILGICFRAIETLDASCRPKRDCLMNWIGQVQFMEARYEEHRKVIEELAHFYNDNGTEMMLLKGYGLSIYWPKAEYRPVGDIDIYLGKLWQVGDRMMQDKLGIKVYDAHEHHTTFMYKGTIVENHYDFINVKAHKDAPKIEAKLKELAFVDSKKFQFPKGSKILLPSADFNVIFLIRHLGQHFAGERITLRQLLDWGLFLQQDGNKVKWSKIIPFLKEMGIWTFFNTICAICRDCLGIKLNLCFEIEVKEELKNRILEDILHPEFAEIRPYKLLPILLFKLKRWWYNRWKHPLVYNEWLVPMFFTLLWSHLRRIETIRD